MKTICFKSLMLSCLVIFFSISFNGCKEKGCTDPYAINYNSVADEDDGSCIICKTVQTQTAYVTADIVDFNFSSSHYQQTVGIISVTQISNKPNDLKCGTSVCKIQVKIQSLVSQRMDFNYQLENNGNAFFNISQFASIQGNQSQSFELNTNQVSNPCGSITGLFFNLNGIITYH